ncbi:hypothetical protein HK104_009195, partial [Borealophlyctis nickersoniae]
MVGMPGKNRVVPDMTGTVRTSMTYGASNRPVGPVTLQTVGQSPSAGIQYFKT